MPSEDAEMTVFVVDDDPDNLRLVTSILESDGLRVVGAADGEQALDLIREQSAPCIYLLDWLLPGAIDGLDLCRRIRSRPHGTESYLILITSRDRPEDLMEGLESGADDFIAKPFDPEDLLSRVRVAAHALETSEVVSTVVFETLGEALERGDGVVVARDGDVVGRIFVSDGRICWAQVSSEPGSLLDVLSGANALTKEEGESVLLESHKSGKSPIEVLADWALVERVALRGHIQESLQRKLQIILQLRNAETIFLPEQHPYSQDSSFTLDELVPKRLQSVVLSAGEGRSPEGDEVPRPSDPPPWKLSDTPHPELDRACEQLADQIPGAELAAVLAVPDHSIIGLSHRNLLESRQFPSRALATLAQLFIRGSSGENAPEKIQMVTGRSQHFLRRVDSDDHVLVLSIGIGTRAGLVQLAIRDSLPKFLASLR